MIHKNSQMVSEHKPNIRGGEGSPLFQFLFSSEELGGRASMLAAVTLQPGESVGVHPHVDNGEVYYILEGKAMVEEDGVETELSAGDAEFCADGHSHAIRNHTDEPTVFLALIVPNR